MIRDAKAAELPEITAFLTARMDEAMFPLANLRAHGLIEGAFASPEDHALRVWRIGRGLLALTRAGNILPYLDGSPDLSGLRSALRGQTIAGVIGPTASARPVIATLGLDRLPAATDRDEPGFGLPLADLRLPDLPGTTLRPLTPADLPLVTDWRQTYIGEVLGTFGAKARSKAKTDLAFYLSRDSHRLLIRDGQPVALTGFNATLPEIVQIGGVYTPAPLRGKGYARRAVALHLAEARAKGVTRAVLFAASEAAAQVYQSIGFQPTGTFTLFLLANPAQITS